MAMLLEPLHRLPSTPLARYRRNRQRTAEFFAIVGDAMYEQPLELRHPFIFYLGHIAAFHFNTFAKRACGLPAFHAEFDELFRRGIDPESSKGACEAQAAWPSLAEVREYTRRVDKIIEGLLCRTEREGEPACALAQTISIVLEHEEMHQETLCYMIKRLDPAQKHGKCSPISPDRPTPHSNERISIPAGCATIGARHSTIPFGWDNEFEAIEIPVPAFTIDALPVTNGDLLPFIEGGAEPPADWVAHSAGWMLRTMFGLVPIQRSWPASVSLRTAEAYALSRGARIMNEAEYHRAASGTPWGEHGNFGFRRFDPEPVGSSPGGASTWGVHELVGNGWEWTSSDFAPLPGFTPNPLYPEYSADFFDGRHSVLKGASPVTPTTLLRPSFRNWFRRDYAYAFTKFRLAYDD
jgi:formylglycine-generating enzyme required for sulfatase activity